MQELRLVTQEGEIGRIDFEMGGALLTDEPRVRAEDVGTRLGLQGFYWFPEPRTLAERLEMLTPENEQPLPQLQEFVAKFESAAGQMTAWRPVYALVPEKDEDEAVAPSDFDYLATDPVSHPEKDQPSSEPAEVEWGDRWLMSGDRSTTPCGVTRFPYLVLYLPTFGETHVV